jgi:hypothetical protein
MHCVSRAGAGRDGGQRAALEGPALRRRPTGRARRNTTPTGARLSLLTAWYTIARVKPRRRSYRRPGWHRHRAADQQIRHRSGQRRAAEQRRRQRQKRGPRLGQIPPKSKRQGRAWPRTGPAQRTARGTTERTGAASGDLNRPDQAGQLLEILTGQIRPGGVSPLER